MVDTSRIRIPQGPYCYDKNGLCEFWSLRNDKPPQINGYCSLLNQGDWEEDGTELLWDQVKECGINDDDDEIYGKSE